MLMTFFDQHGDAFGVALLLSAFFVIIFVLTDRAHSRADGARRATARALRAADHAACRAARARDRVAYWRLHARFMAVARGVTVSEAAAQAELLTARDEPIPYEVATPYLPAFTPGGPLDDTDLHEQFDDLMHSAFISDQEATR